MGPRAGLSTVLIIGALVLLVAIAVGEGMGNRVLGQIANRGSAISATPIPTPTAATADPAAPGGTASWKRREVISVATDPGFPDPRVTPEPPPPPPPPTARPTYRPAAPVSIPTEPPEQPTRAPVYTSPPLPLPIATHLPEETPTPDDASVTPTPLATASSRGGPAAVVPHPVSTARGYPTLPPYSTPVP